MGSSSIFAKILISQYHLWLPWTVLSCAIQGACKFLLLSRFGRVNSINAIKSRKFGGLRHHILKNEKENSNKWNPKCTKWNRTRNCTKPQKFHISIWDWERTIVGKSFQGFRNLVIWYTPYWCLQMIIGTSHISKATTSGNQNNLFEILILLLNRVECLEQTVLHLFSSSSHKPLRRQNDYFAHIT